MELLEPLYALRRMLVRPCLDIDTNTPLAFLVLWNAPVI